MLSPLRVAVAVLAAVTLAPSAALAQQAPQYTVAFGWQPQAPTTLDTVTLTATATTGAAIAWDFDGDGVTDATGAQVQHRFAAAGGYRVTAKATWGSLAVPITRLDTETITVTSGTPPTPTPTPTATPTPAPVVTQVPLQIAAPTPTPTPAPAAPCDTVVASGSFHATSWCFHTSSIPGGKRYVSTFPINVNGMGVGPLGGKNVTIDVTDKVTVRSDNARVYFNAKGTSVQAFSGKVAWTVAAGHFQGFALSGAPTLGGMRITGLSGTPALLNGGGSRLSLYLALPAALGGGTSTTPVHIDLGTAQAAGLAAFTFSVPFGSLPGLKLHNLVVSYDGDGMWDIAGGVSLPNPTPLNINGDIGVRNGLFEHLQASASYGNSGPQLGPITLHRISFRVELLPKVSQCVPKIGKETIDVAGALYAATGVHLNIPPVVIDHGRPVLALCGDVSLSAGPKLLGAAAITLDGHVGFAVYDDRPAVFRADGAVTLVGMNLANAQLEVHSNGYIYAHAGINVGWTGIATLKGFVTLEMKAPKFNAEAGVNACLEFVHFCTGANALISSKGIVACLNVDTFLGDWHPGFGDKWGSAPKLYFSGCDVGPYRDAIAASAAAAGDRVIRLPKGLPGATIVVTGKGAPPQVAFVGPHGQRIVTPADLQPLGGKGYFLMKSPTENITQIAIAKPSAGGWHVETLPGSVPVTRIASAQGLAKPSIHASVHGHVLSYRIKPQAGQVVRFAEHGASAGGSIGTAHGTSGMIRFSPADGKSERRDIVALVEQDGRLRARIVVAHYRAPAASQPGAIRNLRVRRSAHGLVATWRAPRGAHGSDVRVALADGRRLVLRPRGQRVAIDHVARGMRATLTVRELSAAGLTGRPVSVTVR